MCLKVQRGIARFAKDMPHETAVAERIRPPLEGLLGLHDFASGVGSHNTPTDSSEKTDLHRPCLPQTPNPSPKVPAKTEPNSPQSDLSRVPQKSEILPDPFLSDLPSTSASQPASSKLQSKPGKSSSELPVASPKRKERTSKRNGIQRSCTYFCASSVHSVLYLHRPP